MTDHPILFNSEMVKAILEGRKTMTRRCPAERYRSWKVGDRLWVRETFAYLQDPKLCAYHDELPDIAYKADEGWEDAFPDDNPGWKPSIHMPKWAARIFLEVTNIRVERLQDISLKDISAEGIYYDDHCGRGHLREKWINLWDSINKKRGYGWETNPKPMVITFKRIEVKE